MATKARGRPATAGDRQVFTLRLPVDLHVALSHLAIDERKSLNDLIVETIIRPWWASQPGRPGSSLTAASSALRGGQEPTTESTQRERVTSTPEAKGKGESIEAPPDSASTRAVAPIRSAIVPAAFVPYVPPEGTTLQAAMIACRKANRWSTAQAGYARVPGLGVQAWEDIEKGVRAASAAEERQIRELFALGPEDVQSAR